MRILVACEFSGTVRDAFLARGHDAMSCDLLPTEAPGPHHQGDVLDILDDGWDMMIAHPDCTYLTGAAEWCYSDEAAEKAKARGSDALFGTARRQAREQALAFFQRLWDAKIERICIENPVGVVPARLGLHHSQIIQPNWFGHDASKATCLWLRGLPILRPTDRVPGKYACQHCRARFDQSLGKCGCPNCKGEHKVKIVWANQTYSGQNALSPGEDRWKKRAATYPGIASAMAGQWG